MNAAVIILLVLALACFVVEAIRTHSLVCAGLAFLDAALLWPHLGPFN